MRPMRMARPVSSGDDEGCADGGDEGDDGGDMMFVGPTALGGMLYVREIL